MRSYKEGIVSLICILTLLSIGIIFVYASVNKALAENKDTITKLDKITQDIETKINDLDTKIENIPK